MTPVFERTFVHVLPSSVVRTRTPGPTAQPTVVACARFVDTTISRHTATITPTDSTCFLCIVSHLFLTERGWTSIRQRGSHYCQIRAVTIVVKIKVPQAPAITLTL